MSQIYPIAEMFHSVQGEGQWTGTPMFFVRLAGCNVGKYDTEAIQREFPVFKDHSICTTFDDKKFICDTNYKVTEKLTPEEIKGRELRMYRHICISGGEPFMYELEPLAEMMSRAFNGCHWMPSIHIETSGTKPILGQPIIDWITCCPKIGFNPSHFDEYNVDEWKFLVDDNTEIGTIESFLTSSAVKEVGSQGPNTPVYIQPLADLDKHNEINLKAALRIVNERSDWRLSAQLHKYLGAR